MSKAFTRESDEMVEMPVRMRAPSPLPFGAKNYITPQGAQRLQEQLTHLTEVERPALAAQSAEDADARRQLALLDDRIQYLRQSLLTATVVSPPAQQDGRIAFGATVEVRNRKGEVEQYRIVGMDETDVDRGWVGWLSPIAKALLKARLGERVHFKLPSGYEELEIIKVWYEP